MIDDSSKRLHILRTSDGEDISYCWPVDDFVDGDSSGRLDRRGVASLSSVVKGCSDIVLHMIQLRMKYHCYLLFEDRRSVQNRGARLISR